MFRVFTQTFSHVFLGDILLVKYPILSGIETVRVSWDFECIQTTLSWEPLQEGAESNQTGHYPSELSRSIQGEQLILMTIKNTGAEEICGITNCNSRVKFLRKKSGNYKNFANSDDLRKTLLTQFWLRQDITPLENKAREVLYSKNHFNTIQLRNLRTKWLDGGLLAGVLVANRRLGFKTQWITASDVRTHYSLNIKWSKISHTLWADVFESSHWWLSNKVREDANSPINRLPMNRIVLRRQKVWGKNTRKLHLLGSWKNPVLVSDLPKTKNVIMRINPFRKQKKIEIKLEIYRDNPFLWNRKMKLRTDYPRLKSSNTVWNVLIWAKHNHRNFSGYFKSNSKRTFFVASAFSGSVRRFFHKFGKK